MTKRLLRYQDLKSRGIVNNRMTLSRWIKTNGFPPGFMLGANTHVWAEDEVDAFIDSRTASRDVA
jgi:predicted DNA-binding transcriptional regulator AlpA